MRIPLCKAFQGALAVSSFFVFHLYVNKYVSFVLYTGDQNQIQYNDFLSFLVWRRQALLLVSFLTSLSFWFLRDSAL